MEQKFSLNSFHGPHLWTRERARPIREALSRQLGLLRPGDALVIDAAGVEVFDYSFAAEFFGKSLLSLPVEYPGRFLVVEHLTEYARENLERTLDHLNIAIIERVDGHVRLLGKVHLADAQTFEAIVDAEEPVAAAYLRDRLNLSVNAVNERLGKLLAHGLIRRERNTSAAGREQFVYSAPF